MATPVKPLSPGLMPRPLQSPPRAAPPAHRCAGRGRCPSGVGSAPAGPEPELALSASADVDWPVELGDGECHGTVRCHHHRHGHLQEMCPSKRYVILENRDMVGGNRSDSDMHTLGFVFKPSKQARAIAGGRQSLRMSTRPPKTTASVGTSASATRSGVHTGHRTTQPGPWRPSTAVGSCASLEHTAEV